jgi:hypothetical protein
MVIEQEIVATIACADHTFCPRLEAAAVPLLTFGPILDDLKISQKLP